MDEEPLIIISDRLEALTVLMALAAYRDEKRNGELSPEEEERSLSLVNRIAPKVREAFSE